MEMYCMCGLGFNGVANDNKASTTLAFFNGAVEKYGLPQRSVLYI